MARLTVGIHQPNFFPWLGFFDKLAMSDVFVLLDDVQFPKSGGTYINRVELLLNGRRSWVTAPVDRRFKGVRTVNEMLFSDQGHWRQSMARSLSLNYRRHPHYNAVMEVLDPLVHNPTQCLAEYNIATITTIARRLGLLEGRRLRLASKFDVRSASTQRLVELTRLAGGDTYLAGGGSATYQDDMLFESHGLEVRYQSFTHPTYPQRKNPHFAPGLSVIDAAMNVGWNGVATMVSHNRL